MRGERADRTEITAIQREYRRRAVSTRGDTSVIPASASAAWQSNAPSGAASLGGRCAAVMASAGLPR
jgi:hypothetical protein